MKNKTLDCGNSKKYTGARKPTCNEGKPCRKCVIKYTSAQLTILIEVLQRLDISGAGA